MGRPHLLFTCFALAGASACGLEIAGTVDTVAVDDGGGVGSGDGAIGGHDGAASIDGGASDGTSPPLDGAPGPCVPNGTVSCFAPPAGWTVVAYAPTAQTAACPAPFATQSDVEEGPTANNACRCDPCTVTSQPSCVSGSIGSSYDNDAIHLCLIPGLTLGNNPGGACNGGTFNLANDIKLSPPGVAGGGCTSTLSKHKEAFTFGAKGRSCAAADPASAGCTNGICAPPKPPAPYAICIASPGVQAVCPTPFTVRHVVGTDVSFDCAAQCGCTVSAQCSGGSVSFYADTACADTNSVTIAADDGCHANNGGGMMYRSYKYTATPSNVACAPVAPAPPTNVQLTGPTTICCAQ